MSVSRFLADLADLDRPVAQVPKTQPPNQPQIPNPKCETSPGCGPWERPHKRNPNYKGVWLPPRIPNPNYKVRLWGWALEATMGEHGAAQLEWITAHRTAHHSTAFD